MIRPHVYLMRCVINESLTVLIEDLRKGYGQDPAWLIVLRGQLRADSDVWAAVLRTRPFLKVGSTYGLNPGARIGALSKEDQLKTTMMCRGWAVAPYGLLTYLPGEVELEKALHARWDADRIDPLREFFWVNDEVRSLERSYEKYSDQVKTAFIPKLTDDPFAGHRSRGKKIPQW